jgi:glycosyltransferase involved in cell wall biosynthesis
MASKYGTCGEVHAYFSHHDADEAFKTYMKVLAHMEARNIRVMKNRKSAKTLRILAPEDAFHFAGPGGFIGHTAYSLDQFEDLLHVVPTDSILYHVRREDFTHWIADVLDDAKLAQTINGITERHDMIKAIHERRELFAKQVTAVSRTMKEEVMHLYNVPDWKCRVIPNDVVPQQYRAEGIDPGEVKKAYGIHPYAPLILFIGRLVYQKGPDLFIEAIREVCRQRWDARIIVAGDGGMRQYLESRAKDLPVNFIGYIPDSEYIRILNACDLVVIPSRNEPFGLVLLEAWSAEKCVVACDVGGLGENIDSFVNGIKVDVSPQSLARGIRIMIDEPWNAGALGMRGRKKVDRIFLWGPIVERLTDTYSRVVA